MSQLSPVPAERPVPAPPARPAPPTRPASRWRWWRRGATALALLAVVDYVVLPQVAGTRHALDLLAAVRPAWAGTAVALEAASLLSYSLLTQSLLPRRRRSLGWVLRTDASALGLGHVLPGGTAAATALRYRLLRAGGAPAEGVAVGMAVQGVGSVLVLVALWWSALVGSIAFLGLQTGVVVAAVATAAIGALAAGALYERSRRPGRSLHVLDRLIARLPRRFRARAAAAATTARRRFDELVAHPGDLRWSLVWAAGNWLLDAASLWVFLAAFGETVNPVELLAAYGLANLLALLPLTPGGLGVVEAALVSSLVGFGTPHAAAVVGVISWRLFEFWAPIPLGGTAYLSLRVQLWRGDRARRPGAVAPVS